jgi:hypothetical protein
VSLRIMGMLKLSAIKRITHSIQGISRRKWRYLLRSRKHPKHAIKQMISSITVSHRYLIISCKCWAKWRTSYGEEVSLITIASPTQAYKLTRASTQPMLKNCKSTLSLMSSCSKALNSRSKYCRSHLPIRHSSLRRSSIRLA